MRIENAILDDIGDDEMKEAADDHQSGMNNEQGRFDLVAERPPEKAIEVFEKALPTHPVMVSPSTKD